jgi:hypothetical protein
MVVHRIPLIGLIAAISLVTSSAVGRDLNGRYKDLAATN